jgi:phosphoribosylamine--glycine ligase
LMRLKTDFVDVMLAATEHGGLADLELEWDRRTALGVVLATHGYPMTPRKDDPIQGLPPAQETCMVFHAGTEAREGATVTSGGRVLCVTALAENAKAARLVAYAAIQGIRFDGMQYRQDIGHRAVKAGSDSKAGR